MGNNFADFSSASGGFAPRPPPVCPQPLLSSDVSVSDMGFHYKDIKLIEGVQQQATKTSSGNCKSVIVLSEIVGYRYAGAYSSHWCHVINSYSVIVSRLIDTRGPIFEKSYDEFTIVKSS